MQSLMIEYSWGVLSKSTTSRVVYRFFTPPLAGIGKLLALFGRYFGIGITVHVIFCLSYGFH
jgi:hypothetical protein